MKSGPSPAELTRKRYDRFAKVYDLVEWPMEKLRFASWRTMLTERIRGEDILEVGVGTGKNFPFYPKSLVVTALDLSPRMLAKARKRSETLDTQVRLVEMNAENLAFPDRSFDTVFATFVFCSVPDPVKGLRELRRVCRPSGRLLLLEHVRPDSRLLGTLFDLLSPVTVRVTGANINRKTVDNVRKAGWTVLDEVDLTSNIVKLIEAEPQGSP